MARTIQVTPGQLRTAATKIEGLVTDYEGLYKALYEKTNSLVSTWSGKDNVAFVERIGGFKDDFEKMAKLMRDYADFLVKSADAYEETQTAVVTSANKLVN